MKTGISGLNGFISMGFESKVRPLKGSHPILMQDRTSKNALQKDIQDFIKQFTEQYVNEHLKDYVELLCYSTNFGICRC